MDNSDVVDNIDDVSFGCDVAGDIVDDTDADIVLR